MSVARKVPVLARGVRLRVLDDGGPVLLVPEGVVKLNATAAAALGMVDGVRSVEHIARALRERFAAPAGSIDADVDELFDTFRARGWVFFSSTGGRA